MAGFDFEKEIVKAIPKLKSLGMRLTHDPIRTQDLVQDTLLKALLKKNLFCENDQRGSINSWLYRILVNTFIDQQRPTQRYKFSRISMNATNCVDRYGKHSNPVCDYDAQIILQEIGAMPDATKQALQLRIEGYAYEAISQELNIPINTIKTRLHHGKAYLAQRLKQAGILTKA